MKPSDYSKLLLLLLSILFVISMGMPTRVNATFSDLNLITAIQDVARRVIPAVVHIEVTEKQTVTNPLLPFQNDPFFQQFFGNPKMPKQFEREVTGLGSGILIDAHGHVLTNSHLVNGATKMKIVLSDGRTFKDSSVKVIGVDAKTDLAVVKITDRGSFPYAIFGDSDKVEVGQWVVAIGHPQGLDQTVTQGIISAKHRRGISDPSSYQDFLQTDAAINPGNSGGPLLNLNGEVIGVNAAIMSSSGGFEGIGFSIPGNMALYVAKKLMTSGMVERGWLGLTIQNLTSELADSFEMKSTKGAVVANVMKDSPAEKAGMRRGDIIVACDQKPVEDPDRFRNEVALAPIGQSVILTTLRDGRSRDVTVVVYSDLKQGKALLSSVGERFGIEVKPIGQKEVKKYGLNDSKGVIVSRISPDGSFGKAGIERDDIILQINQNDVNGPEQFGEVLSTTPPKNGLLLMVIDHRSLKVGMVRLMAP